MSSALRSCCQWYFDVSCFHPTTEEFQVLLDILPSDIQIKVMKHKALNDQKLSLISALMQRAMIREAFSCTDCDYTIKRTSHNKPFVASEKFPILHWNYNVSHHGSYVTIMSDRFRPIGIDVMKRTVRKSWKGDATSYINQFSRQLTFTELKDCTTTHSHDWEKYTHFFVIWCLKESYIKAVGKGLYMDLLTISFIVNFEILSETIVRGTAMAKIDGRERVDWEFSFSSLDSEHISAIASGPPETFNKYDSSFKKADFKPAQVQIFDLLCSADRAKLIIADRRYTPLLQ